jgi:hypothetical protein
MRATLILVALVVSLGAHRVSAAERHGDSATAKAREFYDKGMTHYNLNEFPLALAAFQDAYRAKHDPAFLFTTRTRNARHALTKPGRSRRRSARLRKASLLAAQLQIQIAIPK